MRPEETRMEDLSKKVLRQLSKQDLKIRLQHGAWGAGGSSKFKTIVDYDSQTLSQKCQRLTDPWKGARQVKVPLPTLMT